MEKWAEYIVLAAATLVILHKVVNLLKDPKEEPDKF